MDERQTTAIALLETILAILKQDLDEKAKLQVIAILVEKALKLMKGDYSVTEIKKIEKNVSDKKKEIEKAVEEKLKEKKKEDIDFDFF
jgi:hypothetical protein